MVDLHLTNMYFFRTKTLAKEFAEGRITQREIMKYSVAWVVILVLLLLGLYTEPDNTIRFQVSCLAEIGVIAATVFICYRMLAKVKAKQFILILMCIAWPELVKYILASGIAGIIVNPHVNLGIQKDLISIFTGVALWVILVVVCARVVWYIRFIARCIYGDPSKHNT